MQEESGSETLLWDMRRVKEDLTFESCAHRLLQPVALEFDIPKSSVWSILPSEVIRENKRVV